MFTYCKRNYQAFSTSLKRLNGSLVNSEIRGRVGIITLNDPARLNALTEAMGREFVTIVDKMNEVRLYFTFYRHV